MRLQFGQIVDALERSGTITWAETRVLGSILGKVGAQLSCKSDSATRNEVFIIASDVFRGKYE